MTSMSIGDFGRGSCGGLRERVTCLSNGLLVLSAGLLSGGLSELSFGGE